MKKPILFFVSILIFNYCDDSINETNKNLFYFSDTLTIAYNQTYYNSEDNLSIQFFKLIGDSRCPEDVVCVWEGDAELQFKLTKSIDDIYFSLHTASGLFSSDTTIWDYKIYLLNVIPYPNTTVQNKVEDYKAVIKITNGK
jgi:hypothetical protein